MTADHDRLRPPRHQARDVGDHDRLAEDDATEDVADRAVRRAVHLLQAELLDPRLVGGDRRALDAHPVPLDRVGRVDRDLVLGRVAALDPEVEVLELDVEVGKDQLLFDERPDDPGHLVAVELDDRVLDFDLRHRAAMLSTRPARGVGTPSAPRATIGTQWQPRSDRPQQRTRSSTSRRRWWTTTSSRPTGRWSRRCGARAAAGPRSRSRELGAFAGSERDDPLGLRWQTRTRPSCAPTTATATGSTRSSSTRSWHELMRIGVGHGLHALPWREPRPGAHVARAPTSSCMSQAEAGIGCPISMTYSVIPALRRQPELAAEWEPRFLSLDYDPRQRAGAERKAGALGGMAMTEKQGGSDVRANTTAAHAAERRRPRRRVRAERPQVVLLGADVRRLPRPRPGRRRRLLLPVAALDARRRAQPLPPPAAQGQARQPLQRLQRDRVHAAPGRGWSARRAAACRRSSRWSTTPGSTA